MNERKNVCICICMCNIILGVSTLTHVIHLKINALIFFLTQINRLIRFDPNFFPSSQHEGYLSLCDKGTANQCCQGSSTSGHGLRFFG